MFYHGSQAEFFPKCMEIKNCRQPFFDLATTTCYLIVYSVIHNHCLHFDGPHTIRILELQLSWLKHPFSTFQEAPETYCKYSLYCRPSYDVNKMYNIQTCNDEHIYHYIKQLKSFNNLFTILVFTTSCISGPFGCEPVTERWSQSTVNTSYDWHMLPKFGQFSRLTCVEVVFIQ